MNNNYSTLEELELSNCGLNSDSAMKVISALNNDTLKDLCLSNNNVDDEIADVFKAFIQVNSSLLHIKLNNNQMRSKGAIAIFPALKGSTNLHTFDISYNLIDDKATPILVTSLLHVCQLEELNIEGNLFTKYDLASIFHLIKYFRTSYAEVNLGQFNSTFLDLLSFIKTEHSLVVSNITMAAEPNLSVDLQRKRVLTSNAVLSFQRFNNVKELKLSGISFDIDAVNLIAKALTNHLRLLSILDLSNCQLDSNAIVTLLPCDKGRLPVVFETLAVLDLSSNKITDSSVCYLVKSFLQMPKLKLLKIDGNQFGAQSITTIGLVLNEFKSSDINYTSEIQVVAFLFLLEILLWKDHIKSTVSLKDNDLQCSQHKSALILTEESSSSFERFKTLVELNLSGLCIKGSAVDAITSALHDNLYALNVLKLSGCQLDSQATKQIFSYDSTRVFSLLRVLKLKDCGLDSAMVIKTLLCYDDNNIPTAFNSLKEIDFS
ncbi:uncharacterized protein [Dysidea avara]|uniref:uncharacterized protein n=1 Tax=Dysidea avara TaxID=196820 RepID=UPI003324331C